MGITIIDPKNYFTMSKDEYEKHKSENDEMRDYILDYRELVGLSLDGETYYIPTIDYTMYMDYYYDLEEA